MSKGKLKANIEWLSDPKIAVTVAVLVLIAIGIVWYFWDKIKAAVTRKKNEIENRNNFGEATRTTDFDTLARQMYDACKGWGTDEDAVVRVLSQILSSADYAELKAAYAKYDKTQLDARLQSEGTDKELAQWRAILAANGVTNYSF